ncbi:autotransporter outer membrane beta-barrel domain-containing protein [Serratia microhaemolytica]|uniref:autotransporter outer membrane beta-barrel domain-containing protein n=1 Tax=Serratia microhaemolytica TaxID=2675110 RepID=UPI000FDF5DFB|nr:autotransporter outer membrane beta-barrel domain-containing protein [Serratia microhaemolytica]
MNKIHNVIWSAALQTWVVVSELVSLHKKSTSSKEQRNAPSQMLHKQPMLSQLTLAISSVLLLLAACSSQAANFTSGGGDGGTGLSTAGGGAGGVAGGGGGGGGSTNTAGGGGAGATATTNAQAGGNSGTSIGGIAGAGRNGGGGGGAVSGTLSERTGGNGGTGTADNATSIINTTNKQGGNATGSNNGGGGGGGGGGYSLTSTTGVNMTNQANITGGNGGTTTSPTLTGGGGGGGAGLTLLDGSSGSGGVITNQGNIKGGDGGNGSRGHSGGGGAGVFLLNGGTLNNQSGTITGGNSGASNHAFNDYGNAGAGVLSNRGTIDNSGQITGGNSAAKIGNANSGILANGGNITNNAGGEIRGGSLTSLQNTQAAGSGVTLALDGGATLTNHGTISGGEGTNTGGVGVSVTSDNNTIINTGTISGTQSAKAVDINGNNNTLQIESSAVLNGDVTASGSGNKFVLAGESDGSIDISKVSGFNSYQKIDNSTWTLNNVSSDAQNWEIFAGKLHLTQSEMLNGGSVTLSGGNLSSVGGVFNGNAILNANAGTIDIVSDTVTFNGVISGVGNLNKIGTGVLLLNSVNTFTGNTLVNEGELKMGIANALASSASVQVNQGASLNLNDFDQLANNLSGSGEIQLGSATLTANNNSDTTFSGQINGSGSLTKTGSATLTLSGANSYSGGTQINEGELAITHGEALGSGTVTNNARLNLNFDTAATVANTISGGELIKTGSNVVTLTASNSMVNSVEVQQGTLNFAQQGMFTSNSHVTQSGATTAFNNDAQLTTSQFTQQANSILSVTVSSAWQPSIFADTVQLDGTLVFNGFSNSAQPMTASEVISEGYILIRTESGISGDFNNNPLIPSGLDYLLHDGHLANGNLDYELDFRLAWTDGGQSAATGNFTMTEGSAFDVDIVLSDQTLPSGGFDRGWDGKSLVKAGAGRLVLSAQNSYTGSTTVEGGVLQFNTADSIASSSNVVINDGVVNLNGHNQYVNRLSGSGGTVQLNGATLTVNNATTAESTSYAGDITGNGGVNKQGNGTLTLTGKTAWTGVTRLDAGTLTLDGSAGGAHLVSDVVAQRGTQLNLHNGASLTGSIDPTSVDIDSASQWIVTGSSHVENLTNNGSITLQAPTASDFKTLTVEGNYQGNDGLLVLNTRLGADDSATDRLVINGDSSGTTRVQVNNAGGSGAKTLNGIRVINVTGASAGEFIQQGRIAAGAYDYTLTRGASPDTEKNWYLNSGNARTERPEGGGYAANLAAANNLFVSRLHDRLGETEYLDPLTGETRVTSLWLRNEGGHNRSRDGSGYLHTQGNRYVLQLGGDIAHWGHNNSDRFHLGMMAGYGRNDSTTKAVFSGQQAKGKVDGYSLGLYGTWYANAQDKSGWYADSWVQYSWFENTVSGSELAQEQYDSKGFTASVEAGYSFELLTNTTDNFTWLLQPKAQITWMGVKADDHIEANGTRISGEGDGNIQTRLGAKTFLHGHSARDHGKGRQFQPFLEANWLHNTKEFASNMDGVSLKQGGTANIAELKLGVEGKIHHQIDLWGNIGQQVGDKGYSDTSARFGVKYNF